MTPNITYRIQFHQQFNFQDFKTIIPYLRQLGIDSIYASPIFRAVPGSQHGYDGTDVTQINPEIGTLAALKQIRKQLRQSRIAWLQDIVPNHMAYHSDNSWLMDVLKNEKNSRYSTFFDTLYSNIAMGEGKLMVPILGRSIDETLAAKEISLISDHDEFYLSYFGTKLPLSPSSGHLLPAPATGKTKEITAVDLTAFNNDIEKMTLLLAEQHYRLCHWQETDHNINYRRFFTVNGLICLNIQHEAVFDAVHKFINELLKDGLFDGLRIDHIDGLYDPSGYLQRLRQRCGSSTYIVAEKILEQDEKLPETWPISGTTGYDFLALCNNVLTDRKSKKKLTRYYEALTGDRVPLEEQQVSKKALILYGHMEGELHNLYTLLLDLGLTEIGTNASEMKVAIAQFLVYFPTYRIYDNSFPLSEESYTILLKLFKRLEKTQDCQSKEINTLRKLIIQVQKRQDATLREKVIAFLMRCMQFTGPVMAKGVEDTLMYTYNRFIAHNEVGDHPGNFGITKKAFHNKMIKRQEKWPYALNASATHDTKRGEDVRARLQLLSAWPEAWITQVNAWHSIIDDHYTGESPHPKDTYAIFQALYGSYPMPGTIDKNFTPRFKVYLEKYLREGKERSDWGAPDTQYEQKVFSFVDFLLDKDKPFFPTFLGFLVDTVDFGILNSLVQTLLKFTCPGIPDLYQGNELWDLSFVDPDNRRPVDYATRQNYLKELKKNDPTIALGELWKERYNGKIKLWLVKLLVDLRKNSEALDPKSEYIGLKVKGIYRRHILAYARKAKQNWVIVIVPLHIAAIPEVRRNSSFTDIDWSDTRVLFPGDDELQWKNVLSTTSGHGTEIAINDIFRNIPLGLLTCAPAQRIRTAGILMHITSLPSRYGIGDLGESAFRFARQLHKAGQKWWQMLPTGPVKAEQGYSPYSTGSAMAGNPLLIDLEALAAAGLLTEEALSTAVSEASDHIDFEKVILQKTILLNRAFESAERQHTVDFEAFSLREDYWLHDYALFSVLHETYQKPWYEWPKRFKQRDSNALNIFFKQHEREIRKEKWLQFIFFVQWHSLHEYCTNLGINLLGDIPIYVAHDSADVWSNPEFFSLNPDGTMRETAGVPPDYFNADGQLWGMPLFNWKALEKDGFRWWIQRIKHHAQHFDQLRLDHFRAFSAYWAAPAAEHTAKGGRWEEGPGSLFFDLLEKELPGIALLAEDLGDIDASVHQLRRSFKLPGMKILQFAFGEDMSTSPHIPHQYGRHFVAYTGTHDNNTLLGWYEEELTDLERERISDYVGFTIDATNVNDALIKILYASVVNTAIVPMQDILKLDGSYRMNSPSVALGNWTWRMRPHAFTKKQQHRMRHLARRYNR